MAKRKVIWSHRAQIKRYEILEFYLKRNKSNIYSKKLNSLINKEINLLRNYPKLGIKTEYEGVRALIVGNLIIFYKYDEKIIQIHFIWDSSQDPNKLEVK
ncbi:type II toxin-antitoxin system RelE/ParE family toxin [candidate division KSB1 bacterium]